MKRTMIIALILGLALPLWMMGAQIKPPEYAEVEEAQQEEAVYISVLHQGQIRQMELETYITSVVLAEMPAGFSLEALKAQAVVARTYAMKRMEQGSKHQGYSVCTEPSCCQGWRDPQAYLDDGGDRQMLDKLQSAVEETAGLVLTYEGKLIDATYFSCSGGSTEAAVEVWGSDVPYLQSVDSPGEENATHYTDQVTMTLGEFSEKTGCSGDPSTWIGGMTFTEGGGVDAIEIGNRIYSGTELRTLLGLRSTSFSIELGSESVTITTKGFGHRVGMSQYGAQAMAQQGCSFQEILAHYYVGTQLVEQ